jgi:hypothetical protein
MVLELERSPVKDRLVRNTCSWRSVRKQPSAVRSGCHSTTAHTYRSLHRTLALQLVYEPGENDDRHDEQKPLSLQSWSLWELQDDDPIADDPRQARRVT